MLPLRQMKLVSWRSHPPYFPEHYWRVFAVGLLGLAASDTTGGASTVDEQGPWRKAGTRGPHCEAVPQSVSKLNLDSQGSFVIETQNFFPFPCQSLTLPTIGTLEWHVSWVWGAGENLHVSFPQGYLDCKGMLSNTADKITCLILTEELEKYALHHYKRNSKFSEIYSIHFGLFPY